MDKMNEYTHTQTDSKHSNAKRQRTQPRIRYCVRGEWEKWDEFKKFKVSRKKRHLKLSSLHHSHRNPWLYRVHSLQLSCVCYCGVQTKRLSETPRAHLCMARLDQPKTSPRWDAFRLFYETLYEIQLRKMNFPLATIAKFHFSANPDINPHPFFHIFQPYDGDNGDSTIRSRWPSRPDPFATYCRWCWWCFSFFSVFHSLAMTQISLGEDEQTNRPTDQRILLFL